ncbi:histidine-specific methyltransferase EgtD [Variibacter gotjawalensis]|uniref:Histidine-specific methyltransferase EgtD n=1 Tax=Variibacter gotjawalensis TaxID=1333996 RepID=A0A0S3PSG9_9BRAD|nr:L-histidine N(alpha)-methyltransferase [Variibacter gotjawalensis]NIK49209.1 dimethylhistidine N-methyltransferase [Variibacter gotjawalensis]RZS51063.1 dimethylhistidine N-methyltransferase [Variibacter gotjawalensis]BAT58897.1 histidine-specific methyltransferase EgtD [Variibacter gotjawalensis]
MSLATALLPQTHDEKAEFAQDVLRGLSATRKYLAPKYFYDARGAELFDQITALPEYYPTRTEMAILRDHARDIANLIPPGAALVEFGAGSSRKARILLGATRNIAAYVPVDISADWLQHEAEGVARDFPRLDVVPVAADFMHPFDLPVEIAGAPRVGFFPGSTIGNLEPAEARQFLFGVGATLGPGAILVIGVDLVKDRGTLNAAYNDAAGVTAAFNLNLLTRINRELGGTFDLGQFEHHAYFNKAASRIEMHLVSRDDQRVRVGKNAFRFRQGESIHTESSYKYTIETFQALARDSGWQSLSAWTDPDDKFSVHALQLRD